MQGVRSPVQKPPRFCERIRVYNNPGDVILEVGCGTAPYARAGLMEARNVLSLDADLEVVAEAKQRLETYVQQDKAASEKKGKLDVPELPLASEGGGRMGVVDVPVVEGWD